MQPDPSYPPGDVIDGRYRVVKLIGRGMSEVYEVVDERLRERRALKIVPTSELGNSETRRRLLLEAEITQQVQHPNVVHVCGISPASSKAPYIIMEMLQGETMRALMERQGAVAPVRALEMIREAALGLEAAHACGVIHRDVKPENLFLCSAHGRVAGLKVIDFGLARRLNEPLQPAEPSVMGTAEYMAPEQTVADPADERADVYSLGVVLFRLITRELPFDLVSAPELMAHQLASIPPPPSWLVEHLDESIDSLVLASVRKSPENRYPSMTDFLRDLERVAGGRRALGVRLRQSPDRYEPRSEMGRDAKRLLTRAHSEPCSDVGS